ncbi:histone deacetylase [Synechocystis sp. LKSZ1]|uniref:histone deacetylase family protein n=1 Tax=Synechocystis sp. LKSZ1 TaxID=3144951 RepID=UPI00336BD3E4
MVTILYSPEFLDHETGPFHPESAARLSAIVAALQQMPEANYLNWRTPTPLNDRDPRPSILQCHSPAYLHQLAALAQRGGEHLDPDTPVSARSFEVALLAVNAWLDGVELVGQTQEPVFVLARPPGHHALRDRGMGFCLLGNAAIAAHYALTQPGINRVMILDWDVHHGNGTEALVKGQAQVAYCSLHQFPAYPGTGRAQDSTDRILNIPLAPGSGRAEYQRAFEQQVLPFLNRFQPDLVIVSAGYDANQADPLASMNLKPQDYGYFSQQLWNRTSRLLFGLEGGYDLEALGQSVVATLRPLLQNFGYTVGLS